MSDIPHETGIVIIDPASLDTQQQRALQIVALLHAGEEVTKQAGSLMDERRCILLRLRDANRARHLLVRADAILGEISRLIGADHAPLRLVRNPPGHWLPWVVAQWACGVGNAWGAVTCLRGGHWMFALADVACVLLCALWRIPYRSLAREGEDS